MYKNDENPYMIDGKLTIRDSFCAYYDILGMKKLLKGATEIERLRKQYEGKHNDTPVVETDNNQELLNAFHPILSGESPLLRDSRLVHGSTRFKIMSLQFSDNVILGFPKASEEEIDFLNEIVPLITQLAFNQTTLATIGIFIRGGITMGSLYVDSNIAFGTALVEAVEVEQCEASNPRIVLSDDLWKQLRSIIERHPKIHQVATQFLCKDSDGRIFINYLKITKFFADEHFLESIEQHKQNMQLNLALNSSNHRIWSKYFWAANYHNYFLNTALQMPKYNEVKDKIGECFIESARIKISFSNID